MKSALGNRFAKTVLTGLGLAAVLGTGIFMGPASADQPHMQKAKDHLQAARAELQSATAEKGGHRVKALKAVNYAIEHVNKGIDFDRKL